MDFSSIFYFEAGVTILLTLWFLCAKPEYGLFFYGLALGFPDIAIPLGTVINLRVDDVLIVLFLIRAVLWRPAPLAFGQRKILKWQAILLTACALSAVVGFASGNPPREYETIKMVGCAVIIFVLPRVLQSERRLRFLVAGVMCAGIALVLQIVLRLGGNVVNVSTNFQAFKYAATFTTWNPNTIGQAAMLGIFAAGIGWAVFPKSPVRKVLWLVLSSGFALIPAFVFVRGTSLSILAGCIVLLCMLRSWKWGIVFLVACLAVFLYLRSANRELIESATRVDVATGEGFSHRFERWREAIGAVRAEPLLGQGFGQEWTYLSNLGSEGRAHNAYLSVWIELGAGGLALLLAVVYQFVSVGFLLYRRPQSQFCGALILALTAALCLDSLGLPTMYWEKLPTISLCLAVALAGICEKKDLEIAPQEARTMRMEVLPQLT